MQKLLGLFRICGSPRLIQDESRFWKSVSEARLEVQLPDRPDRVSRRQFADIAKEVDILTMLRHPSVVRMSSPPRALFFSHTRTHFTLSHTLFSLSHILPVYRTPFEDFRRGVIPPHS